MEATNIQVQNDAQIHYVKVGTGKPMLILHGFQGESQPCQKVTSSDAMLNTLLEFEEAFASLVVQSTKN